jgi:hypothetical protein
VSLATLGFLFVFGSIGAWFGWRYTSVAIHSGTAPRWRRPVGVGRREHARSVRRRRRLWQFTFTVACTVVGAGLGYVAMMFAPILLSHGETPQ